MLRNSFPFKAISGYLFHVPLTSLQSVDWVGADVGEVGDEVDIVESEEGIDLSWDVDNSHDSISVLVVVTPRDGPVDLLLAGSGVEALGWWALLHQVAVGERRAVVLVDLEGVVAGGNVAGLAGPVKLLDSPGSEISAGITADDSSSRGLLLRPGSDNQGRRGVVWGDNRAIFQLSSGVAEEGVQ